MARVQAFLSLWERVSRLLYWRGRDLRVRSSKALSEVYAELLKKIHYRANNVSEFIADDLKDISPLLRIDDESYFEDYRLYLIEEAEEKIRLIYPNVKANDDLLSARERTLVQRADRLLSRNPRASRSGRAGQPIPFRYTVEHKGKAPPSPDFSIVGWDLVTLKDVRGFSRVLESAKLEREVQDYLTLHPDVLIQHLSGGHGRWVIPQQRLGCEFVTDFMIGERSSIGLQWYPVELESPRAKLFNKNGDPSSTLTHAIRQVQDWRRWLQDNIDYARRPKNESGLGLIDVEPQCLGFIVMGRAAAQTHDDNRRRRHMIYQLGIQIRTFDWLLDNLRAKARSLTSREKGRRARN